MAKKKDPELEQKRKRQIILAVARLLSETTHQSMTLDQVAAESGLSKGLVNYYFKGKQALIVETIQFFLDQQLQKLEAALHHDAPVEHRFETLLQAALPSREEMEFRFRFLTEIWSFAKLNSEAATTIRESYRRYRNACEALIEAGVREGYATNSDQRWLFFLCYSLMDGVALQLSFDADLEIDQIRADLRRFFHEVLSVDFSQFSPNT